MSGVTERRVTLGGHECTVEYSQFGDPDEIVLRSRNGSIDLAFRRDELQPLLDALTEIQLALPWGPRCDECGDAIVLYEADWPIGPGLCMDCSLEVAIAVGYDP